jgi:hypothetical protein
MARLVAYASVAVLVCAVYVGVMRIMAMDIAKYPPSIDYYRTVMTTPYMTYQLRVGFTALSTGSALRPSIRPPTRVPPR